jgi:diguanylate cyclase (GGDEF)-like protein
LIVIVLFFGFAFVIFIDHRFIARLSSLSDALRKVHENRDFSVRLDTERNDEIGLAMRNFNDLVGTVEKQTIDLSYQARHDNLTGLFNRNCLMSQLESMIENPPVNFHHAVCFMDLDRFKVVNDTCGHAAGDQLLKRLSEILLDTLEGYMGVTLGRIGGDEFLILFDDKNEQQVRAVMRHISKVIGSFRFSFLERDFSIGVSFGCILFNHENTSASELLSAADAACYQVKHDGGDLVQLYHLHDQSLLDHQRSMDWVGRLYSAIDENQFRVYLQPIVAIGDVGKKAFNHFETLVRLNQDDKIISPFLFIPVAERYGLIKKIDLWVMENLCSRLIASPQFLDHLEMVSINLSGLTVSSQDVMREIDKILLRYPVPYNKLCFEITETGVISEIELAQQFIRYFRNKGIRFALDDFGSGMASFGYLSQLDVDFLKIDGSFIRNMENDKISMEMVETMVNIGRITNKQVVAEQVENQQVVDLLSGVGADFLQGYHFCRPEPIDYFTDAYKEQSVNGGN